MTGDAGGRSAGGGTAAARVGTKGSTLHDIHQALTLDFTYKASKSDILQAFASNVTVLRCFWCMLLKNTSSSQYKLPIVVHFTVTRSMSQVSPECARLWQVASPLHLPVKVSKGQPGKSTSCPRQGRMEARNHRREIMARQLGQYYDVI